MKHIFILALTFCFLFVASATDITVNLGVTAADPLKGLITSYMRREISDLHDVTVSYESSADYVINIDAVVCKTDAGPSGYAISCVVYQPEPTNIFDKMVSPENVPAAEAILNGLVSINQNYLFVCPVDDLKNQCQSIVAQIDSDCFDEARRIRIMIEKAKLKYGSTNAPVSPANK